MKIRKISAAVILALVAARAGAVPSISSSVTVTGSDGRRYVIEALPNTSYAASAGTLQAQPWWGNQALASALAQQVRGQLGNYLGQPSTTQGVLFAYTPYGSDVKLCYFGGSITCQIITGNINASYYWAIGHLALNVTGSSLTTGNNLGLDAARVIDAHANLQNLFGDQISDQQVSNAVSQTLPLLTGGLVAAAKSTLTGINNVIQSRIDANRGLSSGDDFMGNRSLWMKPFGSWADQNERNGVAGYKASTYGVVFGIDGALSPAWQLGGAFAYARSDIDGQSINAPQSADVDVYQLIGYGSYSLDERTAINFQADVGRNANQGNRRIAFTSSVASSSFDSRTAHLGLGIGRTYRLTGETTLTPSVRADYLAIKDRAYSETGAGLLNLSVASRSTEAMVIGIDGKLAHQLNDQTTLMANLGVGYDTINEPNAMTAAFAGAPDAAFVTNGVNPTPWLGRGGLGAVYKTRNGLEITGRYDVEYRESFLNQTASANLRWYF